MADTLFDKLKKDREKRVGLELEVVLKVNEKEMEILTRKAVELSLSESEVLREYVLSSGLFDVSPFEKKSKGSGNRKTVKTEGLGNE